jgi:hypothetical protein
LRPPETYECTTKANEWLKIQKEMLIMIWCAICETSLRLTLQLRPLQIREKVQY